MKRNKTMPDKFKSRKFLLAIFAQVVGLIVLLFPTYESDIVAASNNIGALALMALTAGGWIKAEGGVDSARELNRSARSFDDALDKASGVDAAVKSRLPAIIVLALLLPMSGCVAFTGTESTREDVYFEARADLNAANRVYMSWGRTADFTQPTQAQRAIRWGEQLQEARGLLDTLKSLVDQPGGEFEDKLELFESILIELAQTERPPNAIRPDNATGHRARYSWSERADPRLQAQARPSRERWADHRGSAA